MTIIVFPTPDELADTAAETIGALLQEAVAARGVAHLALSGGGTPRPVYERLGRPPLADEIPWADVHFWWADERCVPPSSDESNYRLVAETLLAGVNPSPIQVHRMRGELSPAAAAVDYADQLLTAAADGRLWPRFDVVVLGMGADGHTASLFPGEIDDDELTRPALAVTAEYGGRPANRVTLTPVVLNAARQAIFLITGAEKAAALAAVFDDSQTATTYPARRICLPAGELTWLVDRPAAGKLP